MVNKKHVYFIYHRQCLFYYHFPPEIKEEESVIDICSITSVEKYVEWSFPCNCELECMGICGRTVKSITVLFGDDNGSLFFYDFTEYIYNYLV